MDTRLEYSLNWQYNIGGSDWVDIPGEVSENYVLTIDQNNQNWNVRVGHHYRRCRT